MDLRLILDGGAAPPAPPGKGIESPPPPEEFEKTLQQAKKGDENPGEVAETEPNAPSQKLDSKEKETGKDISVEVLVEQAVAIPVQFAAIPIVAALQDAVAPVIATDTPKIDKTASSGIPAPIKSTPVAPAAPALALDEANSTQASESKPDLGVLVASFIMTKPVEFTDQVAVPLVMPTEAGQTPALTGSTVVAAIAEQTLPKEIIKDLNVVAIQASTNAVVTGSVTAAQGQQTAEPVVTGTPVTVMSPEGGPTNTDKDGKIAPISKKSVFTGVECKNDGKIVPINKKSNLFDAAGQTNDEGSEKSDKKDDSTQPIMDVQSGAVTGTDAKTAPTENTSRALTIAERQKVVDTLTQKIEELSVRSVRNEVRVEMQPAELGSVIINVRRDLAGLTATLNASNEPLRQALHDSRNDLAGTLADRNVGQVRIEVRGASADTMNMGQQFNQAHSQNQNHQQQQQSRQAAANLAAMNREPAFAGATEQKAAPRRLSTTALDLEI